MSIRFDVIGAGIAAPGLPDWDALRAALAGQDLAEASALPPSTLLSARERRRAPATVRLSFAAAEQACVMAGIAPADAVAVFSSAMGDLDITDYMCRTLASHPEQLSPIRFHNSVHNAASGYWSIGAGARGDVTAVSGWRDSAMIGLVEAITRVQAGPDPVLLVVYDDRAEGPMRDLWPSQFSFAGAVVLARPGGAWPVQARLEASLVHTDEVSVDRDPSSLPEALEARRRDNPAARLLPLLAMVAASQSSPVLLTADQGPSLSIQSLDQ